MGTAPDDMTPVDMILAERLLGLGTATLYEASGLDCDLDPAIRAAWPGARVYGTALPVRTAAADNLALHRAVEQAAPGDVLVVDGRGAACGYWGEVLAVAARRAGAVGLVIDGGVRDVDELAAMGFAAFSRHVAVRRTAKHDPGTVGEPIELAGRPVRRGDLVVADADGVLVLPAAQLPRIHRAAEERARDEAGYLARLRAGELTLDIYGLRAAVSTA